MNLEVLSTCILIIVARITDVSLGTFRTIAVVNGRRGLAFVIGFVEILIWVFVIREVIQSLASPVYAFSYAGGYAIGNWVGITVESRLGTGKQVLRAFSRAGGEIADRLRSRGYVVTCFEGSGREGPIQMLFVETDRREMRKVIDVVTAADPDCFYVLDDVRVTSTRTARLRPGVDWRLMSKRK